MLRVCVPATTANLGAGFDCLGMALSLYNEVEATPAQTLKIEITGEGRGELPTDETNLVWRAAQRVFDHAECHAPGPHLRLTNAIPLESGLGSSAAATVAGLLVGNALIGNPLNQTELMSLAVAMEGHPDNVAPALLGGLVAAARTENGTVIARRITTAPLRVLVTLPDYRLPTVQARRALPTSVSMPDAVFNLGHLALTLVALTSGDTALLSQVMHDRLHQPYRAPLIPGMAAALAAARQAGIPAAISGAGPAILVFPNGSVSIQAIVSDVFEGAGLRSRWWELSVADGATVATM